MVGVIFSGRLSNQIGTDNALLKIDDKTLIEILYERIKSAFEKIVLSTNKPENYNFLSLEKIRDVYPDLNPLSCIHSSLLQTGANRIFIISCDTPFITPSLINYLVNIKTEEMIVVPRAAGNVYYSIGIYSKELLPIAEKVLSANYIAKKIYEEKKTFHFSMKNFVERVGAEVVNVEFEKFYFDDLFFNMKTLEDYEYVKYRLF